MGKNISNKSHCENIYLLNSRYFQKVFSISIRFSHPEYRVSRALLHTVTDFGVRDVKQKEKKEKKPITNRAKGNTTVE